MSESASTPILNMALTVYADEPCRVCGRKLTRAGIVSGAVFAGYSADNTSRAAHKRCWDGFVEICESLGLDWQTASNELQSRIRQERDDA